MDLQLLRSFLAVVDAGAITAAAERIAVTQPALSRRLRQLEEHLGAKLLVRGRKGVELTGIGRLVATEARALVRRYDELRGQVAGMQGLAGGVVRLGGGATAVSFVLPEAIARFQADHPGIRFQLKEAGSSEVARDVLDGNLELGVVTLPVRHAELEVRPLVVDPIVLAARADDPLAQRRRVAVDDLSGRALVGFEAGSAIRQIIDDALTRAGVSMEVVMELRSIPAILRMVATTGNLAFVSRLGLPGQTGVREIAVPGLSVERRLAVVMRRGGQPSPAAAAFASHLSRISGARGVDVNAAVI